MSKGSLKNVEFVSASAGSGKTFTLTERMVELVASGYRPDNFILTTFTKAAAADFKEKVRAKFHEKNMGLAGLENATVGTIDSIAQQFLTRYWYLLGLSPEITVLSENDKDFYVNQTLMQSVDDESLNFFNGLVSKFNIRKADGNKSVPDYDFWHTDLEKLIAAAVNFNISDLSDHSKTSKEMLAELCDMAVCEEKRLYFPLPEREHVVSCLNSVYSSLEQLKDNQTNQTKKQTVKDHISSLAGAASYEDYACCLIACSKSLVKDVLNTKALETANQVELAFFEEMQDNAYRIKEIYSMVEMYVEKIFNIARVWGDKYEEYKKRNQMLDFTDMEKCFDQLLDKEEVVEDIKSKYKVVMVDEFQDCSPLQVRIFTKLAQMVEKNIWVGDVKQAIYGFRGTDVELVEDILSDISDDNRKILEKSWRSAPELVDFANGIFVKAFSLPNNMPEKSVKLEVADQNKNLQGKLDQWNILVDKSNEKYDALAGKINEFKKFEGLQWKDIAILARWNSEVPEIADSLKAMGIPVNVLTDEKGIRTSADAVIQALLALAVDKDNEMSKAVMAQYLGGADARSLIENPKLRSAEESYVIGSIQNRYGAIEMQPVADFVESLFIETGLCDLLKTAGLGNDAEVYSILQWYIGKARDYEAKCANMGFASTLVGFVENLKAEGGSNPADDNGVTIATYHKSKGLEWKAVVLWNLETDYLKYDRRNVTGIHTFKIGGRNIASLIPAFVCNLMPKEGEDFFRDKECYQRLHDKSLKEGVRLLYVGVTRARQYLIVTTVQTKRAKCGLEWFASAFKSTNLANEIKISSTDCTLSDCTEDKKTEDSVKVLAVKGQGVQHQSLYLQPNKLRFAGSVEVNRFADFGKRVAVKGKDNKTGDCIHHFMQLYCADTDYNTKLIEKLAMSYGVTVDAGQAVANATEFFRKMEEFYGKGDIMREVPFSIITHQGQEVNGEIDLIYSTADGDIIVDYKSFPGKISDLLDKKNEHWVGNYAGQLDAYRSALRLQGRNVRAMWICYISLGVMVELKID